MRIWNRSCAFNVSEPFGYCSCQWIVSLGCHQSDSTEKIRGKTLWLSKCFSSFRTPIIFLRLGFQDQKIDDELQLHGCELVILDRYACRLSPSFILSWRGRLLNIYTSLLPSFRHSNSPIREAVQAGVRITGVTVHFIGESDGENDGPIIAQESISLAPIESESQLEARLRTLEQQVYPKAIDLVASGKIVYQGKRRLGKSNSLTAATSSAYWIE